MLTQHLLLQLPLAWRGPCSGTAPACLTLTHLSVCLSVSRLVHEGPVFPETEPLPFSQVTSLDGGHLNHIKEKEGGQRWRGRLHHVGAGSHSEGGLRTVPLLLVVGEEGARGYP